MTATKDAEQLLGSEAARVLDCSRDAVRKAADRGELPFALASGVRIYLRRDVEALRDRRAGARDEKRAIVTGRGR